MMETLFIKFSVSVSRSKYHGYKECGEAEVDIQFPVAALDTIDTGNLMETLLPLALANLPELEETDD